MKAVFNKIISINSYKLRYRRLVKKVRTLSLLRRRFGYCPVTPIWNISNNSDRYKVYTPESDYIADIFGFKVPENDICWNKDYASGFHYPIVRFDKIKSSRFSNKGYDIKFPWELSRFTFASNLAAQYLKTSDKKYFYKFKNLVENWISGNPFLYGVNWLCTMDIAIRAINWLIAHSVFRKFIEEDQEFKNKFSKELIRHAEYIYTFPEIYPGNHSTNHTTADYLGLLFLSVALKKYKKSRIWQKEAIKGITQCLDYQVYEDGGSFEASTSYHRLATEMFSLGSIICAANDIRLPDFYHLRLYKMFEQIESFIDDAGNSPQFGDNDSGTFFHLNSNEVSNYSYLTEIGRLIYGNCFKTATSDLPPVFLLLPEIQPKPVTLKSASTTKSAGHNRYYRQTGLAVLRSNNVQCPISVIPIGQNGYGGHNHYDCGSYHLSIDNLPVVVDPGSFRYTTDYNIRNRFRSYKYHNTISPNNLPEDRFDTSKIFETKKYFDLLDYKLSENSFHIHYLLFNIYNIKRTFLLKNDGISIEENCTGNFSSRIFLSPNQKIHEKTSSQIVTNQVNIFIPKCNSVYIEEYEYSRAYGLKEKSFCVIIQAENENIYEIRSIK
ncbi:MAG: heparinase II/III family protein [Bacteroidales bacterium]|nr:heparinase II/III family protein [Bacteroidales bacterium]